MTSCLRKYCAIHVTFCVGYNSLPNETDSFLVAKLFSSQHLGASANRSRCRMWLCPGLYLWNFNRGVGLLPSRPSRNRIWCFLAIKSDIWWQQLEWFSWESTDQILCTLNTKDNSVTVAITGTLYFLHAGHNVRTITYKTALLDLRAAAKPANRKSQTFQQEKQKSVCRSSQVSQPTIYSLHHITRY